MRRGLQPCPQPGKPVIEPRQNRFGAAIQPGDGQIKPLTLGFHQHPGVSENPFKMTDLLG